MEFNKDLIVNYIRSNDLSIHRFEQLAGVARNCVTKILKGEHSNPTLETLSRIAITINCTVGELLNDKSIDSPHIKNIPLPFNETLYESVNSFVLGIANEYAISFHEFVELVTNIYSYSYLNNKQEIDLSFAKWFSNELLQKA